MNLTWELPRGPQMGRWIRANLAHVDRLEAVWQDESPPSQAPGDRCSPPGPQLPTDDDGNGGDVGSGQAMRRPPPSWIRGLAGSVATAARSVWRSSMTGPSAIANTPCPPANRP